LKTRTIETAGFFDLQVNGFAGVDYNDPRCTPEELLRSIAALRKTGVTRFLPTLITSSLESFTRCARTIVSCRHPAVAGIHMEGPYIAIEARGAHPAEHVVLPSFEDFCRRQEAASGRIVLVTLAPELPGALVLTERLVATGIRVAIGHSAAPAPVIRDAVKAGATMSTHLGNGSPASLPRHPNLLWEQLAADELTAGFIVDGHHLAPAVVKAMMRAKTPARSVLVTDAISAGGQPPGQYSLSGMSVELSPEGKVVIAGTGTLAGAALSMDVAVGNTVRFTGLAVEEVLAMASDHPAQYLGRAPAGSIIATWNEEACRLGIDRVDDENHAR
jgi:N-acetylglucosamine-6-phosphate deacetylase